MRMRVKKVFTLLVGVSLLVAVEMMMVVALTADNGAVCGHVGGDGGDGTD